VVPNTTYPIRQIASKGKLGQSTARNSLIVTGNVNTMPIDNRIRPQISWYGDMNIIDHLLNLLKLSCINTTLIFHPILPLKGLSRKDLAELSINQVRMGKQIVMNKS